jgi:hypothetical protein
MTLNAKNEKLSGSSLGNTYEYGINTIVVTSGGDSETWTIYGASALFNDFPDEVVDYFSPGSQFTNQTYGLGGEATLIGGVFTTGDVPYSVGNLGGYITYYYEDAITDDPNNPYGVDFIVYGNSFEADTWTEPANVLVSADGATWYNLAGSHHYADGTAWLEGVTCFNSNGLAKYVLPDGSSTQLEFSYPMVQFYPLHFSKAANAADAQSFTFDAVRLAITNPPFGYADTHDIGESNEAANPYVSGSQIGDAMDLAWAVDAQGKPVSFPNGIHYIKIQNALLLDGGTSGEYSAEICMVRRAAKDDAAVGKTDAPTDIVIGGQHVALAADKNVYSVSVNDLFDVQVTAADGANIYINEFSGASHAFSAMPTHGIVRVIVQEGEKEPWIAYFNLSQGEDASSGTLTLDANGGTVNGEATFTYSYDADAFGDPLPVPVNDDDTLTFGGWFVGQQRFDAFPNRIGNLTLTAQWNAPTATPATNTINVSFRLIGSTRSTGDVDLADGDYKGAEYVTWLPTGTYTVNENATVADLFKQATSAAGISSEGVEKGYVSAIYAPASLGGYKLSEFTNGPRSGWMYTMDGEHTNAIDTQTMHDGAEIVFHYVDDYAWEVEDWAKFGGTGWPQLSTDANNYWNAWLAAEDVAPAAGGNGGAGAGSSTTTPAAEVEGGEVTVEAEVKDGAASAAVDEKTVAEALKDADDTLTVKVETKDADSVEAALSADAVQAAAAADVDLHVDTEVGTVKVDSDTVDELAKDGKDVAVTVTENADGTITVDVTSGGETVDASVKVELPAAEAGQVLVVVNADGTETVVKKSLVEGDTVYAEIPAGATVKVVEKDASYGDVKPGDWFAEDVEFVTTHGLFEGTDKGFEPTKTMTRGMLATVLYRLEDAKATGTSSFEDLALDKYYTDPAIWAGETGIIEGDENGFDADKEVTREQIATILFRYANYLGLDTSARASLSAFPDGGKTAPWAKDAMSWAVAVGIFEGSDTGLNPGGDATRAQVAAIFQRMVKLIVM